MANPIAVRGIRKILDKVGDEVMEAAKKAQNLEPGMEFAAEGSVDLEGEYGFDKAGDFGFIGKVIANIAAPGVIGEGEGAIDIVDDAEWSSVGVGTLRASFSLSVKRGAAADD